MTDKVDIHRFGGPWTAIKLDILDQYLRAYTTALKNQKFDLLYIDAFAGTGTYAQQSDDTDKYDIEPRKGSATLALQLSPAFSRYIFIEADSRRASQLRQHTQKFPSAAVEVIQSDANLIIPEICGKIDWYNKKRTGRQSRAVLFLDPYGMTVQWDTLEVIAATKAIDLWYLFPIGAALRQAPHDIRRIDESKRAALTRIVGTDEWEKEIYRPNRQIDLFGEAADVERDTDFAKFELFVKRRLDEAFEKVLDPIPLPPTSLQKFSLFFAISNPSPNAVSLAERIAKAIMQSI